ncbi:hypothetical protein GCM10020219_047980 [Nonomuraea dietziae]
MKVRWGRGTGLGVSIRVGLCVDEGSADKGIREWTGREERGVGERGGGREEEREGAKDGEEGVCVGNEEGDGEVKMGRRRRKLGGEGGWSCVCGRHDACAGGG